MAFAGTATCIFPASEDILSRMWNQVELTTATRPLDAPSPLAWRDWPIRDGWRRTWLPFLLLGVGAYASLASISHPLVRWIPPLIGVLTLAKWWAPTNYEVSSRGIQIRFCGRNRLIPWRSIGSIEELPNGFWLAPRAKHALWQWSQGSWLPCASEKEKLLSLLAFYHLGPIRLQSKDAGTGRTFSN